MDLAEQLATERPDLGPAYLACRDLAATAERGEFASKWVLARLDSEDRPRDLRELERRGLIHKASKDRQSQHLTIYLLGAADEDDANAAGFTASARL